MNRTLRRGLPSFRGASNYVPRDVGRTMYAVGMRGDPLLLRGLLTIARWCYAGPAWFWNPPQNSDRGIPEFAALSANSGAQHLKGGPGFRV